MKHLKLILTALALADLVFSDKNTTALSKDQVEKLQAAFKDATGQDLTLTDLTYDAESYATFSRSSLESIESLMAQFGKPEGASAANNDSVVNTFVASVQKANEEKLQQQLSQLQADFAAEQKKNEEAAKTIKALGSKAEEIPTASNPVSDFRSKATGFNSPDGFRFYNRAALEIAENGNRQMASALISASAVDIEKMNIELGEYFRERYPEIQEFIIPTPSLDSIFPPFSTGIYDELIVTNMFTDEFLQPYNPEWAEKGSRKFQPEKIKVRDFKVDHRFSAEEIRSLITSWLAPMTKGTDPFQEPFVAFLVKAMTKKIIEDKTIALIRGVYRQSPRGVAGPAIESINGLLKTIQDIRESFRVKPFALGKWNFNVHSQNHIYRVIYRMWMLLPQQMRDSQPTMNVYTSIDGANAFEAYKKLLATNTDIVTERAEIVPDNVKVIGIPFYTSKVLIMTIPGLIRQFYREKGEDNRFRTQQHTRDTIVFMDGAAGIFPIKSGYHYKKAAEQTYENQIIFLSEEFDDYTYIKVDPDLTILDATVHNALVIGQNTVAKIITAIENVKVGSTIFLLGDSEAGKESTLKTTSNIILTGGDWLSTKGSKLVLREVGGKLIEIERKNIFDVAVDIFGADDETPTLSPSIDTYMTAVDGSDVTITDLLEATPEKTYTIRSSAGTVVTTIAANDNFVLGGASFDSSTDKFIQFYFSASSGKFIEIARG